MLYTGTLQIKKDRPNYYIVLGYYMEDGKRKQKWIATDITVKGNNKRKADLRLKEVLNEYNATGIKAENIHMKDMLFTEYISRWLENYKLSIDLTTYDSYLNILDGHIIPYFEGRNLKIKDITPTHIQDYITLKLKTLSPNTIHKHLTRFSQCFKKAVNDGIILFNPVDRVDKPKRIPFRNAKFYNEQQIIDLLEAIKGDKLETLILFTLFYGLRRSEVLGIKWNAINFDNKAFTIQHAVVRTSKSLYKKDTTKNNSSYRTFPIPDMLIEPLQNLKDKQEEYKQLQPNDYINEGYIFTKVDGSVINPEYVTGHFKKILIANDLPLIRFHDLRHSSASFLLYLRFNFKEIQAWLGHGNINTTMNTYAHLDIQAKENISDTLNAKFIAFSS